MYHSQSLLWLQKCAECYPLPPTVPISHTQVNQSMFRVLRIAYFDGFGESGGVNSWKWNVEVNGNESFHRMDKRNQVKTISKNVQFVTYPIGWVRWRRRCNAFSLALTAVTVVYDQRFWGDLVVYISARVSTFEVTLDLLSNPHNSDNSVQLCLTRPCVAGTPVTCTFLILVLRFLLRQTELLCVLDCHLTK